MKKLMIATLSLITAASSFAQYNGGYGNGGYGNGGYGHYGQQQNQRIQLHIQQHLKGLNILKLKQEIKYQHPGINVRDLQVKAVKIVAKSKMGRGQVTLLSGQSASYPETIGGSPRDFDYGGPQTFDKILIQNPARMMGQGKLQLELKGNIKVKKVVVIVQQVQRAQNIVINTYGQHLRGQNVLRIKQMLRQQNPGLDISSLTIKKVTLIAKSRMGRGQATLLVGQSASYPETIPGDPRSFDFGGARSFSQVVLQNSSFSSQGKVQVELRGNIKIEKVIVTVKGLNQGGGHYSPRPRPRPTPRPRIPRRGRRI